ncbi:hypothetical protein [Candidatus Nitrosotalea okcheonensis]|uniref:Uncharacterized protein n=1 Tax=Candidatus Nitrosotalea okcheonensis TaxID=1903276 RepID=A0A2H1FFR5_9ARCH|nr:hypothetical protein [Candidatus Nitrosotalea okcheonensis]SMH71522.1 protein of unknown function [Candidatus Nitrosotalea okcheonensis]
MGLFGKSKPRDDTIEQMRVLLDNFQFADLQIFCTEILGTTPAMDQEHLSSIELLDFIWDQYHKGKIQFSQIKEFALKYEIVAESFFE